MRLIHLSIASIVFCLVGLVVLAVVAVTSIHRMETKNAEIAELLELSKRIDDISAASDSLLLFGADPDLWEAFQADLRRIQERLERFDTSYPNAAQGARQIALIHEVLRSAAASDAQPASPEGSRSSRALSPLDISARSRIIMNQVAGHGIALDQSLDRLVRKRREDIAQESRWITGTFAGSALLFGGLCVAAFGLIHHRLGGPAHSIAQTVNRVRRGNPNARAQIRGTDEMAMLAGSINDLLDEQQQAQARLDEQQQKLNRLAYDDQLTGQLSRNGFIRAVTERLQMEGWQRATTMVMLDIDDQWNINDAHGYASGDAFLVRVGERLMSAAGENALVGRVGGDEFVVFLPANDETSASEMRSALGAAFDAPFSLSGLSVEANAHFGYTELGDRQREPETVLREAELALFHGRENAGGQWFAYTESLYETTRQRIDIVQELRNALVNDEFELHFHPKVVLKTGEVAGCEALVRWHHPERGLQSPAVFVEIAEQSQLMIPIGEWVLNEACRHLREWHDAGFNVGHMAVNVSLVQFQVGDFTQTVRDALERHRLPPNALTLEITESVFALESAELLNQLRELRELGVRLSLDDFGTGYSSLMYLQKYPFDEIKIDKGFVRDMLEDRYSHAIVRIVMNLAETLEASVIPEGVETKAMQDALIALGCHIGQGFYYSVPLESEDFRWLLDHRSPLPLPRT
ncbi:EAL domain-containing protein [Aquisalimonas lutea]|uniref:putative bifunctional diguanylate cyclase/phosphodiesterase n=1 Tax=Aquisalimonas lutea TaxID=1327750 RepID=UPI0025B5A0DF|nr:bifunctional diguanylate cyclase/phosphodiesterase [Aquisalimonas lutea]MDN3519707.1 EAL domain-containing protein [Aquisalimonas lutea]